MEKIGIMGGSFNPVHTGHLLLAQFAWYTFGLSRVIFIPVGEHAFKGSSGLASGEDRLAMLRLATAKDPHFEVSDMEIHREGVTYTIDTLRCLQKEIPNGDFYFITGADIVFELERWREAEALMAEAAFITAFRPGYSDRRMLKAMDELKNKYHARFLKLETPRVEISSTGIRGNIRRGMPVRYLVPESVADYLETHQLYKEVIPNAE